VVECVQLRVSSYSVTEVSDLVFCFFGVLVVIVDNDPEDVHQVQRHTNQKDRINDEDYRVLWVLEQCF